MAKKVDIEKESMIKMLTPETFNLDVKQLSAKMPVMDAILFYCEQNKLEYETVASLISTDLKRLLRKEAEELNFIPTTSKLPINVKKNKRELGKYLVTSNSRR